MSVVSEAAVRRVLGLQIPESLGAQGMVILAMQGQVAEMVGQAIEAMERHGDLPGLANLQTQIEAICQAIEAGDLGAALVLMNEYDVLSQLSPMAGGGLALDSTADDQLGGLVNLSSFRLVGQ